MSINKEPCTPRTKKYYVIIHIYIYNYRGYGETCALLKSSFGNKTSLRRKITTTEGRSKGILRSYRTNYCNDIVELYGAAHIWALYYYVACAHAHCVSFENVLFRQRVRGGRFYSSYDFFLNG